MRTLSFLVFLFLHTGLAAFQNIKIENLPPLPDKTGFNGSFIGTIDDKILVAGGANFPNVPVWDGGKKQWYDKVYVLEKKSEDWEWRTNEEWNLPYKVGYGVAVEGLGGIICIGGSNGDKVFKDVFLLKFENEKLTIETLPDLPFPMTAMGGDKIGNTIYVAGGFDKNGGAATKHFANLDLSDYGKNSFEWKTENPWPGPPRINPVVVSQNDGKTDKLFLFSGRNYNPNAENPHQLHSDSYKYNPYNNEWETLNLIPENNTPGIKNGFIGAAPSIAWGGSHILIFGGAGGEKQRLLNTMSLQKKLKSTTDSTEIKSINNQIRNNIIDTRFSKTIWAYHTITDTWVKVGQFSSPTQVVTRAIRLNNTIIITGGEIGPGVRTTKTLQIKISDNESAFGILDYLSLGGYLILLVFIGWYYSTKNKTSQSYFLGSGGIPWWAAGLSIYATQLSAITYLALPALAFAYDWQTFLGMAGILMVAPIVINFYIPKYRSLNITSVYEYLEHRFNFSVRLLGSISFVLFQLARMGIVVYLPSLALSTVLGINIHTAIVIMGVLAIIYTWLGGIEAVIWTDVIQAVVLLAGIFISLTYILYNSGGLSEVIQIASSNDKFKLLDLRWSTSELVTWSLFLGSFALNIAPYTTDQTVVQRYLTTKDVSATRKSIWLNGLMSIPAGALIFLTGTLLYVFYKENPELLQVGMENDKIFALFIANQLPTGISGLLIAGIFSATMSSLDSSMHSVSTVISIDFLGRKTGKTDSQILSRARVFIIITGVLGTGVASYMAISPVQSLFFLFQEVLGLMGSALSGIFIVGVFTKKVKSRPVLLGALLSVLAVSWLKYYTSVHFYIYPLVGIPVGVIGSLLFHYLIPNSKDV